METQKITKEQALEMVENNLSSVFTKDDVHKLIMSISVTDQISVDSPEAILLTDMMKSIKDFRQPLRDWIESEITENWSDMVDYGDYELDYDSYDHRITLDSVGCDIKHNAIDEDWIIDQMVNTLCDKYDCDYEGVIHYEEEESAGDGTETAVSIDDVLESNVESVNTEA